MDPLVFDLAKLLIGPVVAVALAWAIGNKISADWALRQRRREQSLATTTEFYRLYGEFFALWKLCNFAFRDSKMAVEDKTHWDLMARSVAIESSCESILLRVASEMKLNESEVRLLGLFRQGVQTLRISIKDRKILGWTSSWHPQYLEFKQLSVGVANLAASIGLKERPTLDEAQRQLRLITDNKWSQEWRARAAKPAAAESEGSDE